MIQETFYRVYPEIPRDRIFIGAGEHLRDNILEQLDEIDAGNLILEPVGRNTAPAIGLAAAVIERREPRSVIAVLSADHVVKPKQAFLSALSDAEKVAQQGYIVTFGIEPTRPATEFGYIEIAEPLQGDFDHEVYTVKRFREKPSLDQAECGIRGCSSSEPMSCSVPWKDTCPPCTEGYCASVTI
jgi:mannose-1-phosphate guanylyltransferase